MTTLIPKIDLKNGGATPAGAINRTINAKAQDITSVKDFGAIGDGTTDDTTAIQAALNASTSVYFPNGSYLISASITLNAGQKLSGDNATIKWNATTLNYAFTGVTVNDIVVSGLTFSSTIANTAVSFGIFLQNAFRVKVSNCNTNLVGLLWTTSTSYASYAGVTLANSSSDILVENCTLYGAGAAVTASYGIFIQYSYRFAITNCSVQNYGQGITFWGGDADPGANGALANARLCYEGSITNCAVYNVGGGGIWGSMGQNITISGNSINTAGDVGIDLEGCFDCTASGNTVAECVNGGLTHFFYNRNIVYAGNSVTQSNAAYPVYRCYNSGANTLNKSVLLSGNTFRGNGVITTADYSAGPIQSTAFIGNSFINCSLACAFNNMEFINIIGNTFIFDVAAGSTMTAISVSGQHINSNVSIKGNEIMSLVTQPAGSASIYANFEDFNSSGIFTINGNDSQGFPIDISINNTGTNAGTSGLFTIHNNTLGAPAFLRSGEATSANIVSFENNMYQGKPWPTVTPTTGKWDVSNKVYFSAPTAGAYIGSVCTTGGTPGTWKTFGAITA